MTQEVTSPCQEAGRAYGASPAPDTRRASRRTWSGSGDVVAARSGGGCDAGLPVSLNSGRGFGFGCCGSGGGGAFAAVTSLVDGVGRCLASEAELS